MSRKGTLYRITGPACAAFKGKETQSEFYMVMGDVIEADTPTLRLFEGLRTWDWALKGVVGPAGTFFTGDMRASSESDPWVILHEPASVWSLAQAWQDLPLTDLRAKAKVKYPKTVCHLDQHGAIGTFLSGTTRIDGGLLIMYEP